MRKVSVTVIYKSNRLYNVTVLTRDGVLVPLLRYDLDGAKPYQYKSFHEMHWDVLQLLKMNNFYTGHVNCFDKKIYNIQFIDLNNPTKIDKMLF